MVEERQAGEFLRLLATTIRSYRLYPEGHPMREENINETTAAALAAVEENEEFTVFVHEDSFFLGEQLLPKESLTLQWLMRALQDKGVRSITISRGIARFHVTKLIDHLTIGTAPPEEFARVNTAALIAGKKAVQRLGQIHAAYAQALDMMREGDDATQQGDDAGMAARVAPARKAVDGLVEAVLVDPSSALLLTTMRTHDEYTFFHMVNVCILSIATGAAIGLGRDQLGTLGLGAILHDMGKVSLPHEVLHKTGALSDEEWSQIRRHPVDGASIILNSWDKVSPMAAIVAYEHHQRMDGGGYPPAPPGNRTNMLSRIVAVADTFDAMTSRRTYRRAEQRDRALEVLLAGAGPHYDPRIVKVFIRMMGFYPPGSVVQLDDGSVAVVLRNNPDALSRPVIKVMKDPEGGDVSPFEFDLNASPNRSIVRGLNQESVEIDPSELIR